ncbi:hypothetical protein [Streptomyces sp. NBC_01180]|uniref:hypothetical protein n=1 Tax=Streptomyces sp. NBC_01180 TaxID=2903763 RepID=UPI0038662BFE|nr:hypothetical protein OG708_16680 [Streptomyces sp. NBC_01180]
MSDQRYPYGQQQPQPQPPQQQPDPRFYQDPHGYQDANGYQDPHPDVQFDQTWDGQTWDSYIQPPPAPYQQEAAQNPYAQQQAPYQQGPQDSYAQQAPYQQSQPYQQHQAPHQHQAPQQPHGAQQSYGPQQNQAHERPHGSPQPDGPQQHDAQQQQPQQPYTGPESTYLPPQSLPLPPETPAPAPYAVRPVSAAAGAPADGPAYSAPSTVGQPRVTDAQRARAEGRSPVIAPGMQPAALTAGLGIVLAAAAFGGRYAVVVPLLVLQAVTAAGWFRLNGMWPARQGIALAFLGGVVADIALLVAGADHGPAAIIGTLGVWMLLTLVLQLRSHAPADERMAGLMATIASSALTIVATGILAASTDAVTVGCTAVAVAAVVRALPLPGPAGLVAALVAAAAAGALAGGATGLGLQGALLGFAAGCCALIGLRVASYDYPSRFVHMTAGVALPLSAAAPAIYLIGRLVG